MDSEKIKKRFLGSFASNGYLSVGVALLWLNNVWSNIISDYLGFCSIIFIILSFLISMNLHERIKRTMK